MRTERLYYTDCYLKEFRASVLETTEGGRRIYLDRTAFYPNSGGQPHDTGLLGGVAVLEVADEGERVAHLTAQPVSGAAEVEARIDWPRRFDHMQQHTGQHLLSAVLLEMYGAQTVGFHLGADSSTIDVASAGLDAAQIAAAEIRANAAVFEDRPVAIAFEEPSADLGLRKPSEREGLLRIVSIEGLDRSACGGTHVRRTGEIGPILIRKVDRAHGALRVEFLCGGRAVSRAHADYEALSKIARQLSAPLDETPALVAGQIAALDIVQKERRKVGAELARLRGRELYESTAADAAGLRLAVQRRASGALDDELRATAQGFTSAGKAVFLAAIEDPPALLLAASADSGLRAGDRLKPLLARLGGRGGGNPQLAQGSLPGAEALEQAVGELLQSLGPASGR